MLELLVLLLPVAFVSGWYSARKNGAAPSGNGVDAIRSDYYQGINYLLNEQQDKAIEAFIRVLEVDSETVDTHLALGNLYRRRGEVDRAIRIHQNLIARTNLSRSQHHEALYELGKDYLSAGLLDRAENLYIELVDAGAHKVSALRHLIDIYEQERDWEKAVQTARDLERVTGMSAGERIAHYHCEQAERAMERGEHERVLQLVSEALAADKGCVRASLLEGDMRARRGELEAAITAYGRVERQDADYVSEVVERLSRCYRELGRDDELVSQMDGLMARNGGTSTTLTMADLKREREGTAAALEFMASELQKRASIRGLDRLLQLELAQCGEEETRHLRILKVLTGALLADRAIYKCRQCGFPAKSLHWQCPGCKHWSSIKPIQGVEGE